MKKLTTTVFFILICAFLFAGNDSRVLLQEVKNKLERVNDYSVNILIKIDVDFLKIKDNKARLYFKKPDKVKMDSRGFMMIPKASLNFSPASLLKRDFLPVYIKADTLDSTVSDVLKLIPTDNSSDIILATLWIDRKNAVVNKIEANTKNSGNFSIIFSYGKAIQYGLPDSAKFFFNISKTKFGHFRVPSAASQESLKSKTNKPIVGHVTIIYSDYKINLGLADSVFEEKIKK